MIDPVRALRRALGTKTDAASASGSAHARLRELLDNRLTTTRDDRLDEQGIKSIQSVSGTWPTSNATLDMTISSVTAAKALVYPRSQNFGTSNNPGSDQPQGFSFPSATTLRVMRGIANGSTPAWYGTVVEQN